ncbi:hypothetical protein OUZ56_014438 [Daphnia magna]|uniref:Uncharacterized protein n=1 Tax=Daphnia magna TaxID=35525 RepID=A0ABR0AJR2_9CRUS|nr:hypothetical protein OUZ56_014438 [Daphnia magna]
MSVVSPPVDHMPSLLTVKQATQPYRCGQPTCFTFHHAQRFMEIKAQEMLTVEGDAPHPTSAGYSSLVSTIDHHLISSFLLMPITQLACIGNYPIFFFTPGIMNHLDSGLLSSSFASSSSPPSCLRLRRLAVFVFAASLSSSSPPRCLRLRRLAVFVFAFTSSLSSSTPLRHHHPRAIYPK